MLTENRFSFQSSEKHSVPIQEHTIPLSLNCEQFKGRGHDFFESAPVPTTFHDTQ